MKIETTEDLYDELMQSGEGVAKLMVDNLILSDRLKRSEILENPKKAGKIRIKLRRITEKLKVMAARRALIKKIIRLASVGKAKN